MKGRRDERSLQDSRRRMRSTAGGCDNHPNSSDAWSFGSAVFIPTYEPALFDHYFNSYCLLYFPLYTNTKIKDFRTQNKQQEIFESFFGTHNPFVDFGFGDTMPFASRLKKQGPRKPNPVTRDLACSLEELYNGCTKAFKVTRKARDSRCSFGE